MTAFEREVVKWAFSSAGCAFWPLPIGGLLWAFFGDHWRMNHSTTTPTKAEATRFMAMKTHMRKLIEARK